MEMILRHIRYLKAVADHGSFTRAAQALHVSQPALSQQVKELEAQVGAQLLDRSGRQIRPTDRGAIYLHHAGRALAELEEATRAVRDVEDLSIGSLRLGVTLSVAAYLLGPLMARFRARYPGVTLTVRVSPQEEIEPALRDDELDLGLGFGDLPADDIEAILLHSEQPSLIVSAEHPATRKASLTAAELAATPLALLDPTFSTRRRVEHYFRSHGLLPTVMVEANSIAALIEMVRHTDLATILPASVTSPGLATVKVRPAFERRRAALLRRRSAYCSAATRAFIATAQDVTSEFSATRG
jgi:LysR family transcriptional regulator, cyn operon transcriptional activator